MAKKVATARKMKSRQETHLPQPNCDSDGKADNKQQAFINTDTRRFKIQTATWDPPPGRALTFLVAFTSILPFTGSALALMNLRNILSVKSVHQPQALKFASRWHLT